MARKKRKKENKLLKLILFLFFILIIIYLVFNFKLDRLLKSIEKERGYIADYYIYGTHLNFTGNIELVDVDGYKISLVLKSNNEEIELKSNIKVDKNNISFKLSENINDGLSLNDLNNGNYYLLLKLSNKDNKKYYSFINSTEYGNLEYYSTTKNSNNKKIDFIYDEDNKTFKISIVKSKLPSDVYDVTIDAGHGKIDTGSSFKLGNNLYYDSNIATETYLIELGYISYKEDLRNIIDNYNLYAKAIGKTIDEYLK